MWSENLFTRDGMKIEGSDWKTWIYKIMLKTGSLKLNRNFESWLTKMTFGYDTSIQEVWCFVKMFFSFSPVRSILVSDWHGFRDISFNNLKDDLILLAYIKLLHSETTNHASTFEISPVLSTNGDFLTFEVNQKEVDCPRNEFNLSAFLCEILENNKLSDIRIDLTKVFPLSIFETTTNATFKIGNTFITKSSEMDEYFYLYSINKLINRKPKRTISFLSWVLSQPNDRELSVLKSLFRQVEFC